MIKYFVWLQLVLGEGNSRVKDAFNFFGNPENIYNADKQKRKAAGLFTPKELNKFDTVSLSSAEEIVRQCEENHIQIISFGDKKYPYCLSVIDNPPLVLYVKGNLPDFDTVPSICIVGPRKVSDFGKRAAYSLSYRIAKSGMTVISGGALGSDTCAHAGALKAQGVTVVVMGCGILSNYLAENKPLREEIAKSGCLISEFPPMANATRFTFPIRNRIMSALSLGTVVIEAGVKSGALITARHSADQGRDVFVIPGPPDKAEYKGSNQLLRDGAKPILDTSDIFNEYIVRFPDKINIEKAFSEPITHSKIEVKTKNVKEIQKKSNETLSKEAKIVYNSLDKQKFLPEEINNTGLSSSEILSALVELELEFLIKALPGGMYEKT